MPKLRNALVLSLALVSGACWAQTPSNPTLKTAMADIDSAAPGVKPDKAISTKLSNAMRSLSSQIQGGGLSADDLPLARLYNAKARFYLAVNEHAFTDADYDREDARDIVYEFEQAIDLMWDQAGKTGKDWKSQIADANWQAGNMVVTIAVDTNRAYSIFFPACAALGHPECQKKMASATR